MFLNFVLSRGTERGFENPSRQKHETLAVIFGDTATDRMFDFLKRKKTKLPDNYKDLIDEKNYAVFLDKCLATLDDLDIKVTGSDNGDITYQKDDEKEAHYYLDNLLRKYVQLDDNERDEEIRSHFNKLQDKTVAYDYLFKDFDYAKQFLKVLVKPTDIAPNSGDFISRHDYPNLFTFLVFDFEEQFHYIRKDKAEEWQVAYEELFKIALDNISKEEIDIKEYLFGDKFTVYILFNGDFSASYTILIEDKLDFAIGTYGSLLAIPTKGTAFIHPIETKDVLDLIEILHNTIDKFYNEDPGNISTDFYWYYKGTFDTFDKIFNDDKTITIKMPDRLNEMYNES